MRNSHLYDSWNKWYLNSIVDLHLPWPKLSAKMCQGNLACTKIFQKTLSIFNLEDKQWEFLYHFPDQLQQLANQPNGQVRAENEQRLRKNKQLVEKQLTEKAQQLLQLRLVSTASHGARVFFTSIQKLRAQFLT